MKNMKKKDNGYEVIEGVIEGKQRSIYFIYSQSKNNIYQINFKPKEDKVDIKELNLKYDKKDIDNAQNKNIVTIFEISFSLKKSLLKFYLEMYTIDKKKKFDSQEEYIIKKDKDLFIYNLEFKGYVEKNWFIFKNDVKPPDKKQLTMMEQFSIFSKYLNDKGLAKIEKGSTKEILVNDSIAILTKNKENFDFDLFLGLFREIYFYSSIKRLLTIFNIKKININKNIDSNQYSKILKVVLNKPNILLKNLDKNENLERIFYDVSILFFKNFEQKFLESLLFPDLSKIKKDEEKAYLNKRAKIMINTILENPEKFSGLDNEIMKKLIDSTNDKKDKLKLLNFTKKLETKLLIINGCLDKIKQKIEIDPNSLEYSIEDNINLIMDYFFNILKYAQKINFQGIFIDIKEEIWKRYSDEFYKNQKIKNLYFIRSSLTKVGYSHQMFHAIDKNIDKLGFEFIEKGNFKNKLLIEFLNNDFLLYENQISKEKINKITKCINLKLIKNNKDPFIQEYKKCNFKNLFKNNYEYFLQKMFLNIETMDSFYNIFKIYSPEDILESEVIKEMHFRFNALLNLDPNINNSIYFNGTVGYLIEIFIKSNNNKFNFKKILDDINANNNLKKEKLADLYNYLLLNPNDNKNVSQNVCENVLKYSEDPYSIVTVMKNIANNINNENKNGNNDNDNNNNNFFNRVNFFGGGNNRNYNRNYNTSISNLKILMEKINNKIFNEEDFLSKKSDKFTLFKLLVEADFFSDKFQFLKDTTYIRMTITRIEDILNKYRSCSFTISEAYQLSEMKDLNEKIRILHLNKEYEGDLFYNTLKEKIDDAIKTKKMIDSVQNYINNFFSKNEEFTNKINELSKKISQAEIFKLKKYEKDINEYKKMSKDAIKANECSKCEFFMNIFRINTKTKKNMNEKDLIKQSIKDFDELIDLLDIKTINNIPMKKLNIILSSKFSEGLIKKQFDFLKEYFDKKVDTTEVEKLINIFSKRMTILNSVNNIKKFFKLFNITNTTDYSENIKNFKIDAKFEKINDVIEMIEVLKNNNINIEVNSIAFDILNKLFEKNGLPEFLLDKKEEDIQNLIEFVGEVDNSFLKASDIQDLMKTVTFFNEVKKYNKEEDSVFMDKFYELSKSDKYKNIEAYIENICKNFTPIRDLYIANVNKSQYTKEKVKEIYKNSQFYIETNGRIIICSVKYGDKLNNKISFSEVIELRDRTLLQKKDEEKREDDDISKDFVKFMDRLEILTSEINDLTCKGYPLDFKLEIKLKKGKNTVKIDKPVELKKNKHFQNDLSSTINILKKERELLEESQIKGYEKIPILRLVYGRQFNLLIKYIRFNLGNINNFIKYITNNKGKIIDLGKYYYEDSDDNNIFVDMINNCDIVLRKILNDNKLTLSDIYQSNLIKDHNDLKGIFSYIVPKDKLEKEVISWYKLLTNNTPIPQTILMCNETTSLEEITAFLYRAILCNKQIFFTVLYSENLDIEPKDHMLEIISKIYKSKDMKSCLAFIFTNRDCDIYTQIRNLEGNKILHSDKKKEDEEVILDMPNIEVVYSDASGIGKSMYIKRKVEELKKGYIFFPIGGEFTRQEIIERLQRLQLDNNSVIHLDLFETKRISLMRDFLFSILITHSFGENENLFYLGNDVGIEIEIPFGFTDFFKEFKILELFKNKKEIKRENLEPLIISKDIKSNIQVVCNYLKCYKENQLNSKNLFIPGISSEFNKQYEIKASVMNDDECRNLIKEYFKVDNATFYQINSFINILANQLVYFSQNFYLEIEQLKEVGNLKGQNNITEVRQFIVEAFIKVTEHFTKGAYGKLLNSQDVNILLQKGKNNDKNNLQDQAINLLTEKEIVSYDKIDPSLVFMNEDGMSFTIICTKEKQTEEYKKLKMLYNSGNQNKEVELINYKDINVKFIDELKKVLNLNESEEEMKKIIDEYVFTEDNFVKMILILHRIRSNIPVIMMGETGCGKTSLIRIISKLKKNEMKILNIHAGITDDDIFQFMSQNDFIENYKKEMEEEKENEEFNKMYEEKMMEYKNISLNEDEQKKKIDEILKEIEAKKQEKMKEKEKNIKPKKIEDTNKKKWVFFDEINTCNSMGLISEIMCKRTIFGKKICDNVIFIAACNPYRRVDKDKEIEHSALVKKNHQVRNLVYNVHPLPHSLLNFVFDFGNLTKEDEKKYIQSMISQPIDDLYKKYFEENELSKEEIEKYNKTLEENKNLALKWIEISQNFIRDKYGIASVSLREVRRFIIFFQYFVDYLQKRQNINAENFRINNNNLDDEEEENIIEYYQGKEFYELIEYSINLSIYICYYLRISIKINRKEYIKIINKEIYHGEKDFLEIPEIEQKFIANRINPPEGIAKNNALLENFFTLFTCVICKVPVFICGKPGCSKSLSVQLLYKAMRGDSSDDEFFKKLPRLFMNSYQGSLTSTSEGVLKIFNKSREIIKNNKENENLISMVYFDEMGLAEISKNNPLKVIHSQLEYDENKDYKVAFVGISNWVLDASKMNRGIYLSIPEPDLEDLQKTAIIIAKSYDNKLNKYSTFFNNLAEVYYKYKFYLKTNKTNYIDFHGSRDFYNLIKIAARKLRTLGNATDEELIEIGLNSIERNFGGLDFSIKQTKEIFGEFYPINEKLDEYKVMECIQNNINDKESRYLLVVSESAISPYLLQSIFEKFDKKSTFLIGSQFEEDIDGENYSVKMLNKIQLCMEEGKILILKNLESIYPSLYDLFNQNFTSVGGKNFSRIALGSSNNILAHVHEDFRCVILVSHQKIEDEVEDPPFLNRFEKHIVSFKYLLSPKLQKFSENLYKKIFQIIDFKTGQKKNQNQIKLEHQLININQEEIEGLVYQQSKNKKEDEINDEFLKEIELNIFKKIVLNFSQDIILYSRISSFQKKYPNDLLEIYNIYKENYIYNLEDFLTKAENTKNVVYTFTSILEPYLQQFENRKIETKLFGEISKKNIRQYNISAFESEIGIDKEIEDFYTKDDLKIIILKFTPQDLDKISSIKFLVDNIEKENEDEDKKKMFIFMIFLTRFIQDKYSNDEIEEKTVKGKELISYLSSYNQIFIDNLIGEKTSIIDILNESIKEEKKLEEERKKLEKEEEEEEKNVIKDEKLLYFNVSNECFYNIKYLFDKKEFLTKNIISSFMAIKYVIKNEEGEIKNQNNYIENVVDKISKDEKMLEKMMDALIKQTKKANKNDPDFLGKIFFEKNTFEKTDVDILKIIKKYLTSILIGLLTKFLVKIEKNNVLSTILYMDNKDENISGYLKKLFFDFLDNIEFKNIPIQKTNEIPLILGINLPFLTEINKIIIYYNNNVKENYSNSDEKLRYLSNDDDVDKAIDEYRENMHHLSENIYNEILKENKFRDLKSTIEEYNFDVIYNKLFDDYFKIFLSKKFEGDYSEFIQILYLLTVEKFKNEEEEKDGFKKFSNFILWIEGNDVIIYKLLNIYLSLKQYIPNLLEKVREIMTSGRIKYEVSKRAGKNKKEVNEAIFIVFESLLKCIYDKNLIEQFDEDKLNKFIETARLILQMAMEIEMNLRLFSKKIFTLDSFISIFDSLDKINKVNKENIIKLVEILNDESDLFEEEDENKNIDLMNITLENEFIYLKDILKETQDFPELIINILTGKLKQCYDEKYRVKIMEIILTNNEFIKNAKNIFFIILKKFDLEPKIVESEEEEEENEEEEEKKDVEEQKKENLENFLQFTRKINPILELLNSKDQNRILDELLLDIFTDKICVYFDNFKDENNKYDDEELLYNLSLDYLKKSINTLESIYQEKINAKIDDKNYKEIIYKNLAKLYCISYIKMYFTHYVDILYDAQRYQNLKSTKTINTVIEGLAENPYRNVLKLFIFKLFRFKMKTYEEFVKYDYTNKVKELKVFEFQEEHPSLLDYLFINIDKVNLVKEIRQKKFENIQVKINQILDNNGIGLLFDKSCNEYFINLLQPDYNSDEDYIKFIKDAKKFIDQIGYSNEAKQFLYLFYDSNTFMNKLKPELKDNDNKQISQPAFEMVLYCYKLCLLGFNKNKNNLYYKLLSKNMSTILKNNFIPGAEEKENLFKYALEQIPKFYAKYSMRDYGAYVCSCGYFYDVPPCGFPMNEMLCPICGLGIGGRGHVHVKRPGHFRILKDQAHYDLIKNYWGGYILNNQNKFFDDFKREVEQMDKIENKGLQKNNFDYYRQDNKQIRKLSQISYRLLNLIIYSELFFGKILGLIDENQLKEILPEKTSCLRMVEENWNLLKNAVSDKGFEIIQIFLNLISQKLYTLIENSNNFEDKNNRNSFEEEVNKLIEETIANKDELTKKYRDLNLELLSLDLKSIKPIIQESNNPEFYSFEEFPFLDYFMISPVPNKEIFLKYLRNDPAFEEKYPVIANYTNEQQIFNLKLLININNINPFVNFMMDYYSYKITREDGKKKLLKDELQIIKNVNDKIDKLFEKFKKGWKKINKEAIKFKCRPEMKPKEISQNDTISFVLNDDGELGYGMYIAAAYQNFIDWQNQFLNAIVNNIKNGNPLYYLIEKIQKPVYSQLAQANEVVDLNLETDTSSYLNLEEIMSRFCGKDCFTKDGKINYSNYKQIKFNFDAIEEELGKIILPGKRLFSTDQKFVTYGFEGYRGDKSSVLQNFSDKYPQNELSEDEKKILTSLLNEKHDFNLFMFSLQILIFYLQKENENKDCSMSEVLRKIKDKSIYNISNDVKDFFNNDDNQCFKINNLLYVYEYIEQFCYNQIEDNVDGEYKKEIDKELKEKIPKYFAKEKILITKVILASAVRKFISRYLSGKRMDNDIKADAELFLFIPAKYELWPKDYPDKEEFDTEIYGLMGEFNVTVAQSVHFYHALGDDNALYQAKDKADNKKNAPAVNNVGGGNNNMANEGNGDASDDENNKKPGKKKEPKKKKKAKVKDVY